MSVELVERELVDRRRGLVGWLVGIVVYAALILSIFPSIRDSDSYAEAAEDYPDALKEFFGGEAAFDITSGAGFLNAQLFSIMVPVLLVIVAIGFGASLGTEQQSGLMDLLLANPVRRRRVVFEKALAMTVFIAVLAAAVFATVAGLGALIDLDVSLSLVVAATIGVVLLVVFHGLVALATAAYTGQRSIAIGVATVVFAAGYLLNALAGLVDALDSARVLSPYHHGVGFNPLLEGWSLGHIAVLVGLCLAVLALAATLFERRDLA